MKQKNNNVNPFNYPAKKYSSYVFDATTKYQKKYIMCVNEKLKNLNI